jgi:hypothetical protein
VTKAVTGKGTSGRRRLPDDDDWDDWARRYLRRLDIPCEGAQLETALTQLDGPAWRRLKAAWRKHWERQHGCLPKRRTKKRNIS